MSLLATLADGRSVSISDHSRKRSAPSDENAVSARDHTLRPARSPIADEATRRLADTSDVLLMQVNDNCFPVQLRQLLHTSMAASGELAGMPERTALERPAVVATAVLQFQDR